jgi:carbon storage regulator
MVEQIQSSGQIVDELEQDVCGHLNLVRKAEQAVMVGTDIKVKVFNVIGNRVKIGVFAPSDVMVMRKELTESESKFEEYQKAQNARRVEGLEHPELRKISLLIFVRKRKQAILIGSDICVTVNNVKKQYAILDFRAPKEVQVVREELMDQA